MRMVRGMVECVSVREYQLHLPPTSTHLCCRWSRARQATPHWQCVCYVYTTHASSSVCIITSDISSAHIAAAAAAAVIVVGSARPTSHHISV